MTSQFEVPGDGDGDPAQIVTQLRLAIAHALSEHRMTYLVVGGNKAAGIVPLGVAVAMEPGSVQLGTDTCWTQLPRSGMICPAGQKIIQVTFYDEGVKAVHDDSTPCGHG